MQSKQEAFRSAILVLFNHQIDTRDKKPHLLPSSPLAQKCELDKIGSEVKVDDDFTFDLDDHLLDEDCSVPFPRRCLLESRQVAFALWTQVASRRTWKVTSEIIILQLIIVLIVSFDFYVFFHRRPVEMPENKTTSKRGPAAALSVGECNKSYQHYPMISFSTS